MVAKKTEPKTIIIRKNVTFGEYRVPGKHIHEPDPPIWVIRWEDGGVF